MQHVNAVVLAGGRSARMGQDKAFLVLGGQTLLDRALELARTVTAAVWIAGPRDKFAAYADVIDDVFPGQGPLAGIHAALRASDSDLMLVLAVDAPFVAPAFLRYLVVRAQANDALVTLPRTLDAGREILHPLCAVYRRSFAEAAESALQAGHNKIAAVFESVLVDVIEPRQIQQLGFDPATFRNLNTPADLDGL